MRSNARLFVFVRIMNLDIAFHAADVAPILSLSSAQVAKLGAMVRPTSITMGSGHRARYGFRHIVEIAIARELAGLGVPTRQIAQWIQRLSGSRAQIDWLSLEQAETWMVLSPNGAWAIGMSLMGAWRLLGQHGPYMSSIMIDVGQIKRLIAEKIQERKG
jgi:hypothetical protein